MRFRMLVIGDDVDGELLPFGLEVDPGTPQYLGPQALQEAVESYRSSQRPDDPEWVEAADSGFDPLVCLSLYHSLERDDVGEDDRGVFVNSELNFNARYDYYGPADGLPPGEAFVLRGGGRTGLLRRKAPAQTSHQARLCDIDVEAMSAAAEAAATSTWTAWEAIVRRRGAPSGPQDKAFWEDQDVRSMLVSGQVTIADPPHTMTQDTFVDVERRLALLPYGYVHQGNWTDRGDLDREALATQWSQLLLTLPSDSLLTLVNLHS